MRHERENRTRTAPAERLLVLLCAIGGAWGQTASADERQAASCLRDGVDGAESADGFAAWQERRPFYPAHRNTGLRRSGAVPSSPPWSLAYTCRSACVTDACRGGPGGQSVSAKAGLPQCHDVRSRRPAARRGGNCRAGAGHGLTEEVVATRAWEGHVMDGRCSAADISAPPALR
ncbi:hypothetical protein OH76DRAFT_231957 [Lentinus brumalis]|uniref:Uncharacterized protein n=1 Tax=Lentinus brumalis TaxID=2498619 RepID=A0A371DHC6_9APHY|nr:hypothetical protein OH76DRAFT_231957 [Polyporus brumalis]